jgi:Protein of unknown function (DUF4090)
MRSPVTVSLRLGSIFKLMSGERSPIPSKISLVIVSGSAMPSETTPDLQTTTGADAIDVAIANGIDFDGSPIPAEKLDLYNQVMALEAGRQRSGVSNTMRSRIVRIGAKHIPQDELNQKLIDAGFAPLKDKEIAFFYSGK